MSDIKSLIESLAIAWYGEEEYNARRMAKDAGTGVAKYLQEQERIESEWAKEINKH